MDMSYEVASRIAQGRGTKDAYTDGITRAKAQYEAACALILDTHAEWKAGRVSREDLDTAKALWVEARAAWTYASEQASWARWNAQRQAMIDLDMQEGNFGVCQVCGETTAFYEGTLGEAVMPNGLHVQVHVDCKPADWEWA